MKRLMAMLIVTLTVTMSLLAQRQAKVACIGNSITYGYLIPDRERMSYPAQLQQMLGNDYLVGNFGRSGATLLRNGHRPYTAQPEWNDAKHFCPDIAVVHLGVNDTDPRDWPDFGDEFVADYVALIDTLRAINPDVRILIAKLSPLRASHHRFKSGTRDWRLKIQHAIENVAAATGVEIIDFDTPLRDRQNLITDGIHPDAEGTGLLARTVSQAITGNYGGLHLPEIYQSGMVIQRNRFLPIYGTADAGSRITLSLGNATYHTMADNQGRWHVTAAPLVTGHRYTMTVTDGRDTLQLTDILAGEVWIASGQSNMEFQLASAHGGKDDIASCTDSMLRIYDMKPIAVTNNKVWPDSVIDRIDRLDYMKPATWQAISPDNSSHFSAVAYHFARHLRDSLQVPVGVISNAVGGSGTEAWIDINTLENGMPEILVDWRGNDYVQKWVQQRSRENVGDRSTARHPYEPSYLFSAAIRPLGHFPVAGAIWYQGESNAHNIEIHDRLFKMLTESWRNYWNDPSMPFYFVQLSSINRPSWPAFRNSQRLLSHSVPDTYMVVSSDLGDSLDVHPVHKREIGRRLALQSLYHTYGMRHFTPSGPEPVKAVRHPGYIIITTTGGLGMHTSDGLPPRTFEIAETDGLYRPATVEIINDNTIKVYNMDITNPRFVRYGWQPFTRANLVNAEGLPASTFKIEADDTDMEAGIECGISAPFAGMIDGRIIMAGGCNFPENPMGADSRKKFYRGIYAADTASMQWQRIGSLPEGMAYGATASVPGGLLLIGGTTATQSLATVWMLSIEPRSGLATLKAMPQLPCSIDNMAACAIGSRVFVAGGNVDGVPSRRIYTIDLAESDPQWTAMADMPGNPRVQPVMAVAIDGEGRERIYIWGGFAPKHDGKNATLELDGLSILPDKKAKWSTLPALTDRDGNTVSVGGGAACTLSDGRIAVCGGVNKDVFLEALRNQAPDYLQHPIEWYRFNPNIIVFNPITGQHDVEEVTAEAARAGAVIVPGNDHDFYLLGGEIKPRIRTSETLHMTDICHH